MAMNNTFREVTINMSTKQPQMVDSILDEAPILEMIPLEPASHGLWNVAEELESVTGAGLADFDGALPEVTASSKLLQVDLTILGGKSFVGEDTARKCGGPGAYFKKNEAHIMRKTGQDAEKSILYNNIRKYAIDNDSTLSGEHAFDAGGTGSTNYSILAVKWVPGQTTGLYDPAGFGRGALMDTKPLNGGNLYEKSLTRNGVSELVSGYGIQYKSYIGIQLVNPRYVSTIVNIDLANDKLPTEEQLDSLLTSVRAQEGGSTWLYMHPKVYTALFKYKADSLELMVGDDNINRTFKAWNGIPIQASYNFLQGTEERVVAP